ncbi:MAG: HAMP domain-containing histidine kinase [Hydrogenophilales bacterium]|nr:HAMP domain-containing histidine kinase [Hydrogenophilales bacterium]
MAPMLAVAALHSLLNGAAYLHVRQGAGSALELFLQLAADAAALAALVYFSGGYANPFISLLLLPLILCAVTIPARYAWAMTFWVAVLYSLLARYYLPLILEVDSQTAIDLHLGGMWLNFLFTAALVSAFVATLSGALRRRDAELAQAREKSLRDEQLFALGMQAASAAHDLATPLSVLSVCLNELEHEYAGDEALTPPLRLMRGQAERMRAVLGRLATVAGASADHDAAWRSLDDWLADLLDHWRLMWPGVQASLALDGACPGPRVRDDPMLVSVLANLLNNAARASPAGIELHARWDERWLSLAVLDRGPGLAAENGQSAGWGVGLRLARAALERFGGDLHISPRQGGGLEVGVRLPLAALSTVSA